MHASEGIVDDLAALHHATDLALESAHDQAVAGTLLAREPLSRSALVLPSRGDQQPVGMKVTRFGAMPSEIHTWASLRHGIALSVVTLDSGNRWSVEGERTLPVGRVGD